MNSDMKRKTKTEQLLFYMYTEMSWVFFSTSSFIFAIEKPFCHAKFEQFLQWFKCVLFSLIDFAHLIHILCHTNSPLKCTMYVC